jgi:hypothetical protein
VPNYRVNEDGVAKARELIDAGKYDVTTEWSEAEPSAAEENDVIERRGYEEYGRWHLAIDPEAAEDTKKRYAFPYGDFSKVYRAALVHAKQRARQNGHDEIADAADRLLQYVDDKRSS